MFVILPYKTGETFSGRIHDFLIGNFYKKVLPSTFGNDKR